MFRILLGLGLTIVAVILLLVVLLGSADNPLIQQGLGTIHCQEGERFLQQSQRLYGNSYSITFVCENANEVRRDVTGPVTVSLIGGFSVLLLLGIIIIIWGARGFVRSRMRAVGMGGGAGGIGFQTTTPVTSFGQTVITMDGKTVSASSLPPDTMNQINAALNLAGMKLDELGRQSMPAAAHPEEAVAAWMAAEYQKESGIDLRNDPQAMGRLKDAAEKARAELATSAATEVNIPFITADSSGPKHLRLTLTRARLDSLTAGGGPVVYSGSFNWPMGGTADTGSLSARLKQLQEARDAGLISADEFARLRQEILDKLA